MRLKLKHPATIGAAFLLVPFAVAQSQSSKRLVLKPGVPNVLPQNSLVGTGLSTSDLTTNSVQDLVNELLGPGVTTSNITMEGNNAQLGLFTGGTGVIGFEQGIVLSSGTVSTVEGPVNFTEGASTDFFAPGDIDLDMLAGTTTFDAAVLEFDFECTASTTVSFQFVFASEEYNEYVFQFNDAFALFLNGQNIALVPGTTLPVTINNVNCGDGTLPGVNCGQFIENDCDFVAMGYPCTNVETEMDGLTQVFSAVATLQPGPNHLKIAVADALDGAFDSAVFLRASSLVCGNPEPSFDPPTPCDNEVFAVAGNSVGFDVVALATNGLAGQGVSITASGSSAAFMNGTFTPALPTLLAQPAQTSFTWVPTPADEGLHIITLTATDQLGQSFTCDVEIRVLLGTPYCMNVANSSGQSGFLYAQGSLIPSVNDFTLVANQLPPSQFIYFLGSRGQDFIGLPGGSQGNLCLGGGTGIARFLNTAGTTTVAGGHTGSINLMDIPLPPSFGQMVLSGETWYFQGWHRDINNTSNFTNALCVTFL